MENIVPYATVVSPEVSGDQYRMAIDNDNDMVSNLKFSFETVSGQMNKNERTSNLEISRFSNLKLTNKFKKKNFHKKTSLLIFLSLVIIFFLFFRDGIFGIHFNA